MGAASAVTDFVGNVVDTASNAVSDVGANVLGAVNNLMSNGMLGSGSGILDSIGGAISDAGSFINNNVIQPVLDHPLESALAITALATAQPELLGLTAATDAGAATGLASLGSSVLPAAEAFGTGAGTLATDAALAAGAGASGTAAADMAMTGAGLDAATAAPAVTSTDPFAATQTVADTTTPVSNLPTGDLGTSGITPIDTTNTAGLSSANLAGTGGTDMTAVNAANAAGASASGTDLGTQMMTGGSGDLSSVTPGTGVTSTGGPVDPYNTGYTPNVSSTSASTPSTPGLSSLANALTGSTGTPSGSTIGSTGLDLTPHMTKGSQISLVGLPTYSETYTAQPTQAAVSPQASLYEIQNAATGGLIQGYADGGAPVSLDPRFTKSRQLSASRLPMAQTAQIGMPTFRAYAEGGEVIDHQPQFYSEGGLNSLQNTYVKGPGDGTSDSVPAMLANGEFVIPADVVSKLGNGSNDAGAGVLDKFLMAIREHAQNHNPSKLPPKAKGPLAYLTAAKKKA